METKNIMENGMICKNICSLSKNEYIMNEYFWNAKKVWQEQKLEWDCESFEQ